MGQSVLLISCPDEPGLVHRATGALFRSGLNIVENNEFVDVATGTFFMRTEFSGEADAGGLLASLRAELPSRAALDLRPVRRRKLVILATREAHCLGDLLLRHFQGELGAEIPAVVSQYPELGNLVQRFGVPFYCVEAGGKSREEHERALLDTILPLAPDYLVLAKYMRVLSPGFVEQFAERIINIHHSFLPAFAGKSPYQQAYERGVKIIGATAHFVNENLDDGPIITQSVIPVDHTHSATEMARAGRDVERVVLAQAVRWVLDDRVIIHGKRTIVFE